MLSVYYINLDFSDELLLMKCDLNENGRRRHLPKGPSQSVIDAFTNERIATGEKVQSIVDINEIVLRCDVKLVVELSEQKANSMFSRFKMTYDIS